eukprot:scaffold219878_cov21-Tisochrysis_lutea.AAC.1
MHGMQRTGGHWTLLILCMASRELEGAGHCKLHACMHGLSVDASMPFPVAVSCVAFTCGPDLREALLKLVRPYAVLFVDV